MLDIFFFAELSTFLEHGRKALEVLDHHRDSLVVKCSHLASSTIVIKLMIKAIAPALNRGDVSRFI